jgi:hypothetical protein
MQRLNRALAVAALALCLVISGQLAAGDKLEPGFTSLFNGKDLTGWKEKGKKDQLAGKTEAHKGRFKVADGMLVIDPSVKGDLYIETVMEFGKDVVIRLDFNPGDKCNNDFFLRGTKFDIKLDNAKLGQWHTLEIAVTGDKIEHKIDDKSARVAKIKGGATPLMIRAEFGAIQIKNIRAKE